MKSKAMAKQVHPRDEDDEIRTYELWVTTKLALHETDDESDSEEADPEECITKIEGRIVYWDENGSKEIEVGSVEAVVIDLQWNWERAGFKRVGRGPFYYVRM